MSRQGDGKHKQECMASHCLRDLRIAAFRTRSHTLPSEPPCRLTARPRARMPRDPCQPSSGSLTRLSVTREESVEEEDESFDSFCPITRPRSNTCPEKRAIQKLRRRIRNRPPTPPPGEVSPSPTGSTEYLPGHLERPASAQKSRTKLGHFLPEVPEAQDFREPTLTTSSSADDARSLCDPGIDDTPPSSPTNSDIHYFCGSSPDHAHDSVTQRNLSMSPKLGLSRGTPSTSGKYIGFRKKDDLIGIRRCRSVDANQVFGSTDITFTDSDVCTDMKQYDDRAYHLGFDGSMLKCVNQ